MRLFHDDLIISNRFQRKNIKLELCQADTLKAYLRYEVMWSRRFRMKRIDIDQQKFAI